MPTNSQGSRSQSPPPSDDEDLVDLPGWSQPSPRSTTTQSDPLDPTRTTLGTSPSDDDRADELVDELEPPSSPSGSSTASTDRPRRSTANWHDFQPITAVVVGIGSLLVRFLRARRRPYLPEHVWMLDDEQNAAMSEPLARIAARHSPIDGDTGDLVDGLTFAAAVGGYAVGNLAAEADAASTLPPPDRTADA